LVLQLPRSSRDRSSSSNNADVAEGGGVVIPCGSLWLLVALLPAADPGTGRETTRISTTPTRNDVVTPVVDAMLDQSVVDVLLNYILCGWHAGAGAGSLYIQYTTESIAPCMLLHVTITTQGRVFQMHNPSACASSQLTCMAPPLLIVHWATSIPVTSLID